MGRNCADAAAVAFLHRASASAVRCCRRSGIVCGNGLPFPCRGAASTRSRAASHRPGPRIQRRTYAQVSDQARIAVVGGGLTGLSTAYYLAKKLPATARITLYEGSDRLGGWVNTEEFKVDMAGKEGTIAFERGPRTLSSLAKSYWRFDDLVLYDLALDLGLKLHGPPDGRRRIFYPDHLVTLPPHANPFMFALEPLVWSSALGFIRLCAKLAKREVEEGGPGLPDEDCSVAEWFRSLTGSDKVADNLASAILHGIYGGDVSKLSARSVLDHFFHVYHQPMLQPGSKYTSRLSKPILDNLKDDPAIQRMARTPKGNMLNFGSEGMESLTKALWDALAAQPNVEIRLSEPVRSISYNKLDKSVSITTSKTNGEPQIYQKVISTLPGQHLARVAGSTLPSLASLKSVSIAAVNLYFPRQQLAHADLGYLIPRSVDAEHNPERALGVFFDSSAIPLRPNEPTGLKLFVLMGGHYYDQESGGIAPPNEYEAIEQARRLLERQLKIPRSEPCFAVSSFNKECIPQHFVGHEGRMRQAHNELLASFEGRLAVAGGSYTHIGTVAALAAGFRAADSFAGRNPNTGATGLEYFTEDSRSMVVPKDLPVRIVKK